MRLKFIYCIVIACCMNYAHAQDLHFSQYFNAPLLINPANTGFEPNYDYRVGINYRNQWANNLNNPYKTMSAWGDVQLFNDRFENGWVGIGGALLKDQAGSGNLSATRAFGSVAYHQLLGYASLLSAGFNIGYINKRVDFTKLTFDNQWNGNFFDASIPSNEAFATNSVAYFDLQAGINYAYFANDDAYYNIGFSAMHVNNPRESFFSSSVSDNRLNIRYTIFLNGAKKLNDYWIVNANAYYSKMGNVNELVVGFNANYNLSGDGSTQLIGGLYYRSGDAIIPTVGYQWSDFKLTVNYDATMSSLGHYNGRQGGYELSVIKSGIFGTTKNIKCPAVKF
ncbi:MAG: hypothetical protein JWN76_368 [Chitinophagaceae bacterium]|nr:hypothetical protein [Chitinophagaceae bacterium]